MQWVGLQCVIVAFPGHTDYSLTLCVSEWVLSLGTIIYMFGEIAHTVL